MLLRCHRCALLAWFLASVAQGSVEMKSESFYLPLRVLGDSFHETYAQMQQVAGQEACKRTSGLARPPRPRFMQLAAVADERAMNQNVKKDACFLCAECMGPHSRMPRRKATVTRLRTSPLGWPLADSSGSVAPASIAPSTSGAPSTNDAPSASDGNRRERAKCERSRPNQRRDLCCRSAPANRTSDGWCVRRSRLVHALSVQYLQTRTQPLHTLRHIVGRAGWPSANAARDYPPIWAASNALVRVCTD